MEVFYFAIFPDEQKETVTVIDLHYSASHERGDWNNVDSDKFFTAQEAICHAKNVAHCNGLEYIPFDSRYDSRTNEIATGEVINEY